MAPKLLSLFLREVPSLIKKFDSILMKLYWTFLSLIYVLDEDGIFLQNEMLKIVKNLLFNSMIYFLARIAKPLGAFFLSPYWIVYAKFYLKDEIEPRISGYTISSNENNSIKLFCTGVPVKTIFCLRTKNSLIVYLILVSTFFALCPSSTINRSTNIFWLSWGASTLKALEVIIITLGNY